MQSNLIGIKVHNNSSGAQGVVRAVTSSSCGQWLFLWVEDSDGYLSRWNTSEAGEYGNADTCHVSVVS